MPDMSPQRNRSAPGRLHVPEQAHQARYGHRLPACEQQGEHENALHRGQPHQLLAYPKLKRSQNPQIAQRPVPPQHTIFR